VIPRRLKYLRCLDCLNWIKGWWRDSATAAVVKCRFQVSESGTSFVLYFCVARAICRPFGLPRSETRVPLVRSNHSGAVEQRGWTGARDSYEVQVVRGFSSGVKMDGNRSVVSTFAIRVMPIRGYRRDMRNISSLRDTGADNSPSSARRRVRSSASSLPMTRPERSPADARAFILAIRPKCPLSSSDQRLGRDTAKRRSQFPVRPQLSTAGANQRA
jgi:hypothetical protein